MEQNEIKNFYNKIIKNKYGNDYEYSRWFSDSVKEAGFRMTFDSIFSRLDFNFKSYLEVGPGQGTWTKLFLGKFSEANYDLVDISSEMLRICQENLKNFQINYIEADFTKFHTKKKYDFIFSSRALEYFPDKFAFVKKMRDLLEDGGRAIIITKTPKYIRNFLLKRKISDIHKGQISPKKLKKILKKFNFSKIEIYPAIIYFPFLKSPQLNIFLYKIFSNFKLNLLSYFFSESYLIKIKK